MFESFLDDKVPNVRLILSQVIRDSLKSEEWSDNEKFKSFEKQLLQDEDRDVQYFIKK